MKRFASKALSLDEEEPLDAVEPTQGLEFEPQRVQDEGNDGEGSIQGDRGVAPLSTEAGLGVESCSFQDVLRDAVQANRGFAVHPMDSSLRLGSGNFQGQPNVEELAIQGNCGVAVQLMQASIQPIRGAVVQPMQAGPGLELQNFQENPNVEERGGFGLQPTQEALSSITDDSEVFIEVFINSDLDDCSFPQLSFAAVPHDMSNLRNGQAGVPHPEEETGSNDGSVPPTPRSDINDLGNGQGDQTQGLEFQPERVQDRGIVGEGSIQAASGMVLLTADADLGLEPRNFQEVLGGAIQANRGFAVQPTGLESRNFQEQPNFQALVSQASSGVGIPLTQAGSMLELHNFEEQLNVEERSICSICGSVAQPKQAGLGLQSQNFQEQPNLEERVTLPSPLIRVNDRMQTLIDEAIFPIGECRPLVLGCTNNLVSQTPPSNINDLRTGQGETSHQEAKAEAGGNDRIGPQASPVGMDNPRNDGRIELADPDKPIDDEDDIASQARAGQQQMQGEDEPVDDQEDVGIQARAGQQEMQDGAPQQGSARRRIRLFGHWL